MQVFMGFSLRSFGRFASQLNAPQNLDSNSLEIAPMSHLYNAKIEITYWIHFGSTWPNLWTSNCWPKRFCRSIYTLEIQRVNGFWKWWGAGMFLLVFSGLHFEAILRDIHSFNFGGGVHHLPKFNNLKTYLVEKLFLFKKTRSSFLDHNISQTLTFVCVHFLFATATHSTHSTKSDHQTRSAGKYHGIWKCTAWQHGTYENNNSFFGIPVVVDFFSGCISSCGVSFSVK